MSDTTIKHNENNGRESAFLPQYILDALADKVALKLDYLVNYFNYSTVFADLDKICVRIENKPLEVFSVIVKAKNDKAILVSGTSIRKYHVMLTRIYILLYYRHCDDATYKDFVLKELLNNMGIYGKKEYAEQHINKPIDNIRDIEKQFKEKQKKIDAPSAVPMTSVIYHSLTGQVSSVTPQIFVPSKPIISVDDDSHVSLLHGFDPVRVYKERCESLEEQNKQLSAQNKSLTSEVEELRQWKAEQLAMDGKDSAEDIPHDKVRLELFWKLAESDGADITPHGNKTKMAKLMRKATGLPYNTCKNYCTNRDLKEHVHQEEIKEVNQYLDDLNMNARLPDNTQ